MVSSTIRRIDTHQVQRDHLEDILSAAFDAKRLGSITAVSYSWVDGDVVYTTELAVI